MGADETGKGPDTPDHPKKTKHLALIRMRFSRALFSALLGTVLAAAISPARAEDWSRFRGPNGLGVVESSPLPAEFGPSKNLVWKTPLPMGKSSPALTADRIFLTAHEDEKLLTLCLDRKSGEILWRRTAPTRRLEVLNRLNDEASSSPVTDGANVYVFFGGYGLFSLGPDGGERWKLPLGPFTNFHGMAASPVLADGKLLMVVDQDQNSYLLALNAHDGSIAWKTERPEMVHSFSTPIVYRPASGEAELIVPGSYQMAGYSIETGKKLWWIDGLTYQVKSGPVLDGDTMYFNGWAPGGEPDQRIELPIFADALKQLDANGDGRLAKNEIPQQWQPANWEMQDLDKDGAFDERDWRYYAARRTSSNAMQAIRLGGRGDVTKTHVLWRYQKSLPDVPSVLLYEGVLYGVKSGGIVTALRPATGEMLKQGRLPEALDGYYASPVAADGKIYMASDAGKISVLAPGADWTVLAVNDFAEPIYATPAIAEGRLYVRTNLALYCFAKMD
jgi:outer membrane protein assembly factor BamB